MSSIELKLTNPWGEIKANSIEFHKLSCARSVNNFGALDLYLFPNFPFDLFGKRDWRFEIWRNGGLLGQTPWLTRFVRSFVDNNGDRLLQIKAVDALHLAHRRRIPYNNGTPYTSKQAAADNVLKAIMRENYGSLATDSARNLSSYLSIEADKSLAPQVTKTGFSQRRAIEVFREICDDLRNQGAYLAFDIVDPGDRSLVFRTYLNQRGANHASTSSDAVIVSESGGTLLEPEVVEDTQDEANYIYATGQGTGDVKPTQTAQDAERIGLSPFNRMEEHADASNTQDAAGILAEAQAQLGAGRPRVVFAGKIQESNSLLFGRNFDYGDVITAEDGELSFDCHVDAFSFSADREHDALSVQIRGERNG